MSFSFRPMGPCAWRGRYPVTAGARRSVFHVRSSDGLWWPTLDWVRDSEESTCWALDDGPAGALAEAVNQGKVALGGQAGGSFIINEFGQVITPGQAERRQALVGEVRGVMLFEDPLEVPPIDLSNDAGLELGDEWTTPYIGSRYNLSMDSVIYFWHGDIQPALREDAPEQDEDLINALREIRPQGGLRFRVNPHGIVLTKVPEGDWRDPFWRPTYVGRIDYEKWFRKEEQTC